MNINHKEFARKLLKTILAEIQKNHDRSFFEECNSPYPSGRDPWMPARMAHDKDLEILKAAIKELE